MTRLCLLLPAAGFGLLLAAAWARRAPGSAERRPSAALRAEQAPQPRSEPGRRQIDRRIPDGRAADAFDAASRSARARLDAAWRERDLRVLSLGPELPPQVWEARQREAQDAYERAKEEALRGLHDFLSERPEYRPLRFRVEEWVDSLR